MANKVFFKSIVFIIGLMLQFNVWSKVTKTVHVAEAGTLSTLIDTSQKNQITDLVLTGKLNGTDIRFIREMAGRDYNGNVTNGKLTNINLEGTNINVAGGRGDYFFYLGNNYTYFNFNNVIPDYMFYECRQLRNITIPSATAIGYNAFWSCSGLTNFSIPNSVTFIGGNAFAACQYLTNIIIPNSVHTIDYSAFAASGLTNVIIPNSITEIRTNTFQYCSELISVTIPKSVTTIANGAFWGCTGLTEIHSKNPTPPFLGSGCFYGVNKTTCKLFVPKGSYAIYRNRAEWSEFQNIIEEDFTSITAFNKNIVIVKPVLDGITIETNEQTSISVYNLSGQKVYQSIINRNTEIRLAKGMYIVRINSESQKVFVK